ncbi:hypothetical protein IQ264_13800 [Phormidium sp. LEGE 05292]|uniref:hypothetical protein n=1 Tax=[Phormidium] sp. LEGE 05292 TaxID=767427 RepID=UPI00187EDA89|nr:hypothetical protein [Phormidium sp. LEGE 05292]MBE9226497.1 hypothetical protein [Phormidium sp. LEGE 05292]
MGKIGDFWQPNVKFMAQNFGMMSTFVERSPSDRYNSFNIVGRGKSHCFSFGVI